MKYIFHLEKKLEKLSSYRVIANDIKPDNIIYYDGDFKLVDCDFYRIDDKLSYSDILEKNIKLLNDAFNKILNDYFNRQQEQCYNEEDNKIRM